MAQTMRNALFGPVFFTSDMMGICTCMDAMNSVKAYTAQRQTHHIYQGTIIVTRAKRSLTSGSDGRGSTAGRQ